MREFSLQFLDNQPEIVCTYTKCMFSFIAQYACHFEILLQVYIALCK